MALKKDYSEGTKFYYARVERVTLSKYSPIEIAVHMYEKDTEDEDHNVLQSMLHYSAPTDEDMFSMSSVSAEGANSIKQGYEYVKANVELFKDYEDC